MLGLMPCDQCSSHSEYASKWMKMKQKAFSLASKTKEVKLSKEALLLRPLQGQMGTQAIRVLLVRGSPCCKCKKAQRQSCLYCGTGGGPRKTRVLHRNLLLLCDFILVDEVNPEIKKPAKREVNMDERREKQSKHREREPDSSWDERMKNK